MDSIFGKNLLEWHSTIERDLPWKNTNDPYKIWLSEIILQQTRVEQGRPYYIKFIELFPTVYDLADAPEDVVLHAWQGLGYYSRARNLHQTAKTIVSKYNGQFPNNHKDILSLKGIGAYTAAAIGSFAFDLPYAVLDGNVKRVVSRYFGVTSAIDETSTLSRIKQLLDGIFISNRAALFNQAIMDFGALFCKPKNPDCFNCPFKNECIAFRDETVSIIPYKSKKIKRSKRYFHYFVITFGDKVYINKRLKNDIWKGLFEFPLIETKSLSLKNPMIQFESVINLKGFVEEVEKVETLELAKHVLSHQDLFVTLHKYRIRVTSKEIKMPYKLVELNNLKNFAFPRVLTKNMDFILYKQ